MIFALLLLANVFTFEAREPAEVVAQAELLSPGADWAVQGKEAAVARVELDGAIQQQIVLYGGSVPTKYRIFLGEVSAGKHRIKVTRDNEQSAPGTALDILGVQFRQYTKTSPEYAALAHAPVLYARKNTIGR